MVTNLTNLVTSTVFMLTVNLSEIPESISLKKSQQTLTSKETPANAASQVAREFESLLLTQITSSLRTKPDDGDDQNSDNSSVDLSQQLIAEQMAQVIAKNGGVGLVDVLMKQLEKQKQGLATKENSLQNLVKENINNKVNQEERITRPRRIFELPTNEKPSANLVVRPHNPLSVKTNSVVLPNQVSSTKELDQIILEASKRHGVDPYLVAAVVAQESSGRQFVVSNKGAVGYMQLLPATFREFGGNGNIFDARNNINAGVAYIKFLSDKYNGDIDKVLAGYNAGPANVNKHGGIPPFPETMHFVASVKNRQNQLTAKNELTSLLAKNVNNVKNVNQQNQQNISIQSVNTSSKNNSITAQNALLKTTSSHLSKATATTTEKEVLHLPVEGKVSSNFGSPRVNRTHKGVDIAVSRGTTIEAANDGEVVFSGWQKGYGKTLVIQHKDGRLTRYAHAEDLFVSKGEKVNIGQKIATVGSTGNSTGPHLHFEVIEDGKAVNPLLVAKAKVIAPSNTNNASSTNIASSVNNTASSSVINNVKKQEGKFLTLATVLPIIP